MRKSKAYHPDLIESLRDPREAENYLNAALEEGDPELFLLALRNVAEAQGGVAQLAEKTKLNRESLYKMLSERGNPELRSLGVLLHALGFRLAVASSRQFAITPYRTEPGIQLASYVGQVTGAEITNCRCSGVSTAPSMYRRTHWIASSPVRPRRARASSAANKPVRPIPAEQ
jgi:probable addiction module antidote protein